MSTKKSNPEQKKVIIPNPQRVTPAPTTPTTPGRVPQRTTPVVVKKNSFLQQDKPLIFGRENYKWALIGLAIMTIGFICMSGGAMPSPDVWDESLIYSPVRIILAPFLVIAGLCVVVYSIFVKNNING